MKTLAEIRKSAWRELIANKTITVYDFAPCHEFPDDYRRGHEVNRRRPIPVTPFDKLAGDVFSVEIEPPRCPICDRWKTYANGEWYCRFCG